MNTYFDNYTQAEAAMGWPKAKLKLAKKLGADGFRGNRTYPDKLLTWYDIEINKNLLETKWNPQKNHRPIEEVKLSIAEKEDILKGLEIQRKKGEYLIPQEVNDFLIKLRLSFESTINGWATELPPKFIGKTSGEIELLLKNEISILFSNFAEQIKRKIKENISHA